ncbi:Gfo/Idh/MocA family oxidoreductase [Streptomyces sp. NPDC053474]|uniref:Gfo/Idh/MocA family oxidoreductase n=1 Tax=Streptomyces sp. NPDC053474 TaxID=3365704 RepID=UPI0037D68A45
MTAAHEGPPLRLAIAGMGWSGRRWLRVAQRTPGISLHALVSRSSSWPDADTSPGPVAIRTGNDLGDVLGRADIDAVVVCTPPEHQVDDALVAVSSGKAVIVEKPGEAFSLTTPDGSVAHTGCVAFGLECFAYAFLCQHGLDEEGWPDLVRERLLAA